MQDRAQRDSAAVLGEGSQTVARVADQSVTGDETGMPRLSSGARPLNRPTRVSPEGSNEPRKPHYQEVRGAGQGPLPQIQIVNPRPAVATRTCPRPHDAAF